MLLGIVRRSTHHRRRMSPRFRVRGLEPGDEADDVIECSNCSRSTKSGAIDCLQYCIRCLVVGECLGRTAFSIVEVAKQAKHNRPIVILDSWVATQVGKPRRSDLEVARLQIRGSQRESGHHVGTRTRQRPLPMRARGDRVARLNIQPRDARDSVDVVRVKRSRLLICGARSFGILQFFESKPSIEVGGGHGGVKRERTFERLQCLIQAPERLEAQPNAVQNLRIVGRSGLRTLEQPQGIFKLAVVEVGGGGQVHHAGVLDALAKRLQRQPARRFEPMGAQGGVKLHKPLLFPRRGRFVYPIFISRPALSLAHHLSSRSRASCNCRPSGEELGHKKKGRRLRTAPSLVPVF